MKENIIRIEKLFSLMEDNSVSIVFSGVSKISSADEYYPFVVDTNFFYLTNIKQENSILLLVKGLGETRTYLFIDEYNEVKEKWTGKKLTFDEARELSSINGVYATKEFPTFLDLALTNINNQYGAISLLYTSIDSELKIKNELYASDFSRNIPQKYPHIKVNDINIFLRPMRAIKSEYEIECIKQAIIRTNSGIADILANLKPGISEYSLSDRFEFYARNHDRTELAFSTICASGKNATCLHYPYPLQNDVIKNNDLVLFDLGYRYNRYCGDISRTYPVSGVFNDTQRKVYETVLKANKAVIEYARKGLTLIDLNNFCTDFLKNECIRVGLMDANDDIRKYYYHSVSHHLGLDTHDIESRETPLMPGHVITVEPGLYFASLGIGVRIEDDVLITDTGNEVLSSCILKEIDDIEKLLKKRGN